MRQTFFFRFAAGMKLTKEQILQTSQVPGVSMVTIGPVRGHIRWNENDEPVPVEADATTLKQVMACAQTYQNGLKVRDTHFGNGVGDFAGRLMNFREDGPQLRGDFEIFEEYPARRLLAEAIEKIPDTFGFSINFSGPAEFKDGKALARCTEIYSCDIVDQPAANEGGMFDTRGGIMKHIWTEITRLAGFAPAAPTTHSAAPAPAAQPPPPAAAQAPVQPAALSTPPAQPAAPQAAPAAAAEPTMRDVMSAIGALAAGLGELNTRFSAPSAPVAATPPAAPAAPQTQASGSRMSPEQLQAFGAGVQMAARAGARPVENPAGETPATAATQEDTRNQWARGIAAQRGTV